MATRTRLETLRLATEARQKLVLHYRDEPGRDLPVLFRRYAVAPP